MRTSSVSTKFTSPCWCRQRMSYFFFFSESWFFLLVQSGATSRASVEDDLLRELFDVFRRTIRMRLYTIVAMWMTTNAWYIRKWALFQVICQIVEINWYWKTWWVRPPGTWRFVSSSSSVWLFHWKWHLSDGSRISDNCDGVVNWICESLWTRLKSCGFADARATVYYVTWVHGHSVDTIDHIATCLFLTRRKIVSLSDFARDEGPDPRSDWNFSDKIVAKKSTDVERHEVFVTGGDSQKMSQIARRGEEQPNNRDSWWSETDRICKISSAFVWWIVTLGNKTFAQRCSSAWFVDLMSVCVWSVADLEIDLLDE